MELTIPTIIQGYAQGYFLMADETRSLGWYSSRQRAIIPLDERFRYPTSLRRVLNQKRFSHLHFLDQIDSIFYNLMPNTIKNFLFESIGINGINPPNRLE